MIQIDGSYGEGGGQIIRTAIGLSCVTGKPCRIFNIRKNRNLPGLKPQHYKGIEAAKKMCNADVKGLGIGSTEIEFHPHKLETSSLKTDIGTAGSITLLLQTLMIPAIHSMKTLTLEIIGGTHVKWSPTTDYFQNIFCSFMQRMGIKVRTEILRYGFYPKGGGHVKVVIKPGELKPLNLLERGEILQIQSWSIASQNLKHSSVAERQIDGAEKIIRIENPNVEYVDSLSAGTSIHLQANCENSVLGCSVLGESRKSAESVGREAANLLKEQMDSGACLDEWMTDQILPYLALAKGKSEISVPKITKHAETNMWIIKKFIDTEFTAKKKSRMFVIECSGS